jgi:hypothetical protein
MCLMEDRNIDYPLQQESHRWVGVPLQTLTITQMHRKGLLASLGCGSRTTWRGLRSPPPRARRLQELQARRGPGYVQDDRGGGVGVGWGWGGGGVSMGCHTIQQPPKQTLACTRHGTLVCCWQAPSRLDNFLLQYVGLFDNFFR